MFSFFKKQKIRHSKEQILVKVKNYWKVVLMIICNSTFFQSNATANFQIIPFFIFWLIQDFIFTQNLYYINKYFGDLVNLLLIFINI